MSISRKFILSSTVLAFGYIILITYLRNFILINDTFLSFSLIARIKLYLSLLLGMSTSMTPLAVLLMFITAILTGINITLIGEKIISLKRLGKIHIVAGGSSLLGIVGGGCAACGLPIISLLGLSGSVLFLPFKGAELPYISIFLLLVSLFFLIKDDKNIEACDIK